MPSIALAARYMPCVTSSSRRDLIAHLLESLVERAPAYDTGVGVIALQCLQPLRYIGDAGFLMVLGWAEAAAAPVAELAPDKVAQSVGMVQEPLLENFLMQACTVEADSLAPLNVGDQGGVGGRGHHAVGIVALVQHEPLEDRLAVDLDLQPVNGDCAQPGIAGRAVYDRAIGIAQGNRRCRRGAGRRPTTDAAYLRGWPKSGAATRSR